MITRITIPQGLRPLLFIYGTYYLDSPWFKHDVRNFDIRASDEISFNLVL